MAGDELRFALNHMAAPQLDLAGFFALARTLELQEVEIRNDIAGRAIADGTPAAAVREAARDRGVSIISINALQRFNEWTAEREAEATALARYARDCGAAALVLVPVNDGTGRANGERQGNLRVALKGLKPILAEYGITGLVECLGFERCSMRHKREAADAIHAVSGTDTFRLVHDTFHHYLAGETDFFAEMTGLVHVSGVSHPTVGANSMGDEHRELIDGHDRLSNLEQIAELRAGGYAGPFSYEPFAESLRRLEEPARAIGESMEFTRTHILNRAA